MTEMRTLDGGTTTLAPEAIDAFRAAFRGPLLFPADPGYDDARALWNAMIDRRPGLIARATGTADVVAAVRFAREHGLLSSVKGGGHNIAGLAVCDGGLMIDCSLMKGVWVDPAARTARAQPGCTLGDLDRETQLHGLAAPIGFVSTTGIAGLTVGGGFGYLSRQFGWTCDNLVSVEVVTAEGQRRARRPGRARGALLVPARRRRELRHRHVVRVQALPRRARRSTGAPSSGRAPMRPTCSTSTARSRRRDRPAS